MVYMDFLRGLINVIPNKLNGFATNSSRTHIIKIYVYKFQNEPMTWNYIPSMKIRILRDVYLTQYMQWTN